MQSTTELPLSLSLPYQYYTRLIFWILSIHASLLHQTMHFSNTRVNVSTLECTTFLHELSNFDMVLDFSHSLYFIGEDSKQFSCPWSSLTQIHNKSWIIETNEHRVSHSLAIHTLAGNETLQCAIEIIAPFGMVPSLTFTNHQFQSRSYEHMRRRALLLHRRTGDERTVSLHQPSVSSTSWILCTASNCQKLN